ncbi:MAG: hypothetical protein HUK40_10155 [Desulfobacter sp.]|nr:hypothetical protein [Desulfobacter sp.]
MDCKEFQHWLTHRDIHDQILAHGAARHIKECRECKALFLKDNELEQAIVQTISFKTPPRGLEESINASLDQDAGFFTTSVKKYALAITGLAAACIVLLALVLTVPPKTPAFKNLNQISLKAVTTHLKGNQQMDFNADDVDQALALLTKELGFKVLLPDFATLNCILLGGRLCAIGECRAAYFVIEQDQKKGSLFIMNSDYIDFSMAEGSRFNTHIKGCETCVWKNHDQVYAMVF